MTNECAETVTINLLHTIISIIESLPDGARLSGFEDETLNYAEAVKSGKVKAGDELILVLSTMVRKYTRR